uniref:Uncharacterized protein n=1 Tax=Plectus sambesii TaxID=2011161 RepID=A0A914V4G8_9BILA
MTSGNVEKLKLGNKLAVLGGDFLLANASVALANLCAPQVTSSVAQGIADMSEAEFLSLKHPDRALPQDLWDRTIYLQSGSLLAHSCKSTILLADLDDQSLLDNSFTIGRRVALIYA